jgi:hypothetical protein
MEAVMSHIFLRHLSPLAAIALVSPFVGAPALAQAHIFRESVAGNGPRATHNLQELESLEINEAIREDK